MAVRLAHPLVDRAPRPLGGLRVRAAQAVRSDVLNEPEELVTILETRDLAELTVVRSLLDAEGIAYVVVDEEAVRLGMLRALNPLSAGSAPPTAKIRVSAHEADDVEALLGELALDDHEATEDDD